MVSVDLRLKIIGSVHNSGLLIQNNYTCRRPSLVLQSNVGKFGLFIENVLRSFFNARFFFLSSGLMIFDSRYVRVDGNHSGLEKS